MGSHSCCGDVAVYVFDINQPSFPTPFYSVLVSVSICLALSTVFHSPDNSAPDYSVLLVLFLLIGHFNDISLYESLPQPWYNPLWLTRLKGPTNMNISYCEAVQPIPPPPHTHTHTHTPSFVFPVKVWQLFAQVTADLLLLSLFSLSKFDSYLLKWQLTSFCFQWAVAGDCQPGCGWTVHRMCSRLYSQVSAWWCQVSSAASLINTVICL